jgi:hypothetical protein
VRFLTICSNLLKVSGFTSGLSTAAVSAGIALVADETSYGPEKAE